MYESGRHVPFIVRIPKKYKYLFPAKKTSSRINRLISFVDLAHTLLSITGIPIPEYMQVKAFLGNQKTEDLNMPICVGEEWTNDMIYAGR